VIGWIWGGRESSVTRSDYGSWMRSQPLWWVVRARECSDGRDIVGVACDYVQR